MNLKTNSQLKLQRVNVNECINRNIYSEIIVQSIDIKTCIAVHKYKFIYGNNLQLIIIKCSFKSELKKKLYRQRLGAVFIIFYYIITWIGMNTALSANVNLNLFNALFFNTEFESSLYTFFLSNHSVLREYNFIMTNTNSTTIIPVEEQNVYSSSRSLLMLVIIKILL